MEKAPQKLIPSNLSDNDLISTLKASKLMRLREEVLAFDNALTELAENATDMDLEELLKVLDDNCEHEEVMWGLVHFLESFDASKQLQALLNVVQELVVSAPRWTEIIHYRIFNDEPTRFLYQDMLMSVDLKTQQLVTKILEDIAQKHELINV
ncbi:Imm30 family immunity protein [Scytonema sp. NUACC26]|uniref:Imm30 family immunity protein n=1 Tax=Scytonema sp. NUACC26 TaxID=3140176 RepID=UPI0034DC3FF5